MSPLGSLRRPPRRPVDARERGRADTGSSRRDAGDTLIEVLIALVILAVATLALLTAFATSISASAQHRQLVTFDTVIRSAVQEATSEIQQQADPLFESCAPVSYYQSGPGAVSFSLPSGYTAQVTQVQYWNGTSFTATQSACVANSPEWITVTVTQTATGQTYSNNFIVDDPYAPPVPEDLNAYQLVFVQQPAGATVGNNFTTQPAIAIEDQAGHVVTTDLSPVTLTITPNTGTSGATLSSYCTGVENSGVVTFSDCSINTAGIGYQLTATDPGLVSAISIAFNVETQINSPVITAAAPSSTESGAINVTFTSPSNAPSGETYTATACSTAGAGFGCVTQNGFSSGSDITGLTPGSSYYVTITANATGPLYLSGTSSAAGPVMATVQLNAPGTPTLAYGSVPGSLQVSFATPTPAAAGQLYTATACTNAAMTSGCVSGTVSPGGNLTGLSYAGGSAGSSYYVDVVAAASSGYLASPSSPVAGPQQDESAVNAPTNFSVSSSNSTAGAITVTFTASTGSIGPSSYTLTLCQNAAMTANCTSRSIGAGATTVSGLTQGTSYYAQVTANAPTSAFASANTSVAGPAMATVQLTAPSGITPAYGSVAGSIAVTFSAPANAASGQTYTLVACSNASMSVGCVTSANYTSGANLTGLTYTQGSAGSNYWVTVASNASSGYFASGASSVVGPQAATSQVNAPGTPVATTSTAIGNAITVTFSAPSGTAPSGYTATACTNSSMTHGCVSGPITSGGSLSGLSGGTSYYVTVTALGPAGYTNATSGVSLTSAAASIQLTTPTINSVSPSTTTAGQLSINFTGSSNGPFTQTYTATACTNSAMTTGCVTQTPYTSNAAVLGLTSGTYYYVTITANSSVGYIGATSSVVGPTIATVQLATPGTPTLAYGTVAGSIAVTVASSNAPAGQLYTVKACTNASMTYNCVTDTNVVSGGNATGLNYTAGSAGSTYYVTAYAQASSGYLQSGTSGVAGPQAATSQLSSPGTPSVASSSTTAGAITATFTASSGPTVAGYSATACTNSGMTQNCVTQTGYTSGAQLTGLTQGSSYYVAITALSSSAAYAPATSNTSYSSAMATVQLTAPTISAVAPSTSTSGALTISYTGSTNAPFGESYTATACTNSAMTQNCVTHTGYSSGSQFSGLTAGSTYYVTITATASSGYLAQASSVVGPTSATVQLATPGTPTLAYGTVAGSIAVTVASSNAPAGQLYTVKACTNSSMTYNCVTDTNVLSGGNATGLNYTAGSAGSTYYVTAYAQASSGYLQSGTSGVAGPQAATSSLNAPTSLSTAPSTTTAGALTATFTASSGQSPSSYTATACTDAAMSQNCVTQTGYTSGSQLTGLTQGETYYVTVTAVSASAAYVSATSSASGPTAATTQLGTPSSVTLGYGAVAGSVSVSFTAPANASPTQTYTAKACTNSGMTTGCVTSASFTSGSNLSGLAYTQGVAGTNYYVTVTANASSGYLVSATSSVAGPQADTSQLDAPGQPTVASSTILPGAVTATFSSAGGVSPSSYTATACSNSAMTIGCLTQTYYSSGAQIQPLTEGTSYYVTITSVSATSAFLPATSPVSASAAMASIQLTAPVVTAVAPSSTTSGALTVTFTGTVNGPGTQTYSAEACTDAAMTQNCVTQGSITSGGQLTGLTQGGAYYVEVIANASAGYLSATSSAFGPAGSSVQLAAPTGVTLAYGPSAGSIQVSFTGSSNAPGGQTYTLKACTNSAMTSGCTSNANFTSGSDLTGLPFTQGSAGANYWVTVTANASTGYIAGTSAVTGPQAETSQVNAPGTPTVTSSSSATGAITATFSAPAGVAPQSYTATACTNSGMSQNCVTQTGYSSGAQIVGLTAGSSYYVTVTAVGGTGYASATSSVSSSSALATVQLAAPTGVTLGYGPSAGSIQISFTGSSNAPVGETYSVQACTNAAMNQGCATSASFTSGSSLTGLPFTQGSAGTNYWVVVTANATTGYLAAASAVAGPQAETSQVNAPTGVTLGYGPSAGSIQVSFTGSLNAPGGQTYSVQACTNAAMTQNCASSANFTSGSSLTGLPFTQGTAGTSYWVTVTATASTGYVAATSGVTGPQAETSQVNAPTNFSATSSTTTAGAILVTFTGSTGTAPSSYTAQACTNSNMTGTCTTVTNFTSGSQISGLTQGTPYYVQVTANGPAGYTSAATAVSSSVLATVQLATPTGLNLAYGTVAGSVQVNFTGSSNAPGGETYTATACTNLAMNTGCHTSTIIPGANFTGLPFTQGSAGTTYYVTVAAQATAGYLASAATSPAGPQAETSQVNAPTGFSATSSTTTAGAILVTFTGSSGTAPSSYTAQACTGAGMTGTCTTVNNFSSGSQISGLTQGTSYYVQVTANGPTGYTSAATAVSSGVLATVQLNAPTGVTLAYGTVAGSVKVTFTAPSNAAAGQTYTAIACKVAAMNSGCTSAETVTSGGNLTGLAYTQGSAGTAYYVQVTASASTGYLASAPSSTAGPQNETSQVNAPTNVSVSEVNYHGTELSISFTASSGVSPSSYTAEACTSSNMTTGCITPETVTSGGDVTGLSNGTTYYVEVTAVGPSGYTSATSSPAASATTW